MMFVRYPYKRNDYYRSRAAPMEIDKEYAPIWDMTEKKNLSKNDDNEMDENDEDRKNLLKAKKMREKQRKEDSENESNSQNKLVKYVPRKSSSGRNKYEDEEQMNEYTNDSYVDSENDYDENNIPTENQISFGYQSPSKLIKPVIYNNYYSNEQTNKKSNSSCLKDSNFPQLLMNYSKFLFNVLLLVVAIWVLFYFIITVKKDINIKYKEHLMDNMKNISDCYEKFEINKCSSDIKIPALEDTCKDWETCINKDPDDIKIIMIGAEVVSEILNKFIDPLSLKSTIVIIILCTIFFSIIWKMNSVPSNKQKEYNFNKKNIQNKRMNDENIPPLGMCPPSAIDSRYIGNGFVYQVAPAAIYPNDAPYPIPMAYQPVYPYSSYSVYQQEPESLYLSPTKLKYRKVPSNSSPSKKGYRIFKSNHDNRNPNRSRFKVNPSYYPPHNRRNIRNNYYYDNENDDTYEDDYDSNYDEDYD